MKERARRRAGRKYETHQLEEVQELVGIFPRGEVHKVPWDPVAQTGAGLHRHLAGGVAERRPVLHASPGLLLAPPTPPTPALVANLLQAGFPGRQLLPGEQQRVGHLAKRVQVDEPDLALRSGDQELSPRSIFPLVPIITLPSPPPPLTRLSL